MGTVWLAHPYDAPEQLYAVKMVSAQYAADARVCTMFVKEASLAAAIDHPNVVRLYDVGLEDDVPFFVMEWIDGYSLREVARTVTETGERVPASIALRIASDLCGGLHAAHELCGDDGHHLGLVHRDVSPHNVLVTREGVAKLIDFGVAKARDLATGENQSVCGGLKGKVRYMAPEQALEKEIDRRADLFSVGAVVYQLLTGRAPFEGPNELAIINSLLSTNPVYVPEDLPEPVQWILRRALARRPENRFADAAEMQNAIELALVELGQPDTHAHVAECLAWFDPAAAERASARDAVEEHEEVTSARRLPLDSDAGTQIRQHGLSQPPPAPQARPSRQPPMLSDVGGVPSPALAFAMPNAPRVPAASIPARQSSLVDDDPLMIPSRTRTAYPRGKANESSWRFVLMGAGFVGVLGIIAALVARDAPASTRKASSTTIDNAPLPASTNIKLSTPATTGGSPNTPIIELGDLDESSGGTSGKPSRPKVRRPPPSANNGGGGGAAAASPPSSPAKSGDLAGPIKVWK